MFNLHHLHYFYVCAQSGSVTKAAQKLGISQPSLSSQIRQFESQIGMQLLVRSGRTLTLTPRGQELFSYGSRIFEITEQVERFINKNEQSEEFDLRIGVSDEVERPFIADILGHLVKMHGSKKITSTIVSDSHDGVSELLMDDQIDVVISNQKIPRAKPLAEVTIPVILATARSGFATRIHNISHIQATLEQLGQSLILPMEKMVLGKETRGYLKSQGVKSVTSLQTNILACVVRAVEEGVGAAFLPAAYVNYQFKKGLLSTFGAKEGYWRHKLYVYAKNGNTNPFFDDLVKIMNDLKVLN